MTQFDAVIETPWRDSSSVEERYDRFFGRLQRGKNFLALHFNAPGEIEFIDPPMGARTRVAEYEYFRSGGVTERLNEYRRDAGIVSAFIPELAAKLFNSMIKKNLKFGLIGAGFIGRTHALAIHAARQVFADLEYLPVPHMLCEVSAALAEKAARNLGFERFTDDWRKLVDAVDAVIVAVPSQLHREIALNAFASGKHLLCEKPVGLNSEEVEQIRAAAKQSTGVSRRRLHVCPCSNDYVCQANDRRWQARKIAPLFRTTRRGLSRRSRRHI